MSLSFFIYISQKHCHSTEDPEITPASYIFGITPPKNIYCVAVLILSHCFKVHGTSKMAICTNKALVPFVWMD